MKWQAGTGKKLELRIGDITKVSADAIVNAANSALMGGGGVDGAIHRAGGPSIMQELNKIREQIGKCPAGSAVVTGAGALRARYIFHAVGPVFKDGRHHEPELLASCYRKCLELAEERRLETIAFPSISTGAYGYPIADAARIAVREVANHLNQPGTHLREATFVLFDQRTYDAYKDAVSEL